MIIGVTGLCEDSTGEVRIAGAGKDKVCDFLYANHGVAKVALADPLKRICQEVYGFTYEQLWGPSEYRNAPDKRYIRMEAGALGSTGYGWRKGDPTLMDIPMYVKYQHLLDEYGNMPSPPEDVYLTPRHALQQLGTEWARNCYSNTWVAYGLKVADQLLGSSRLAYEDWRGVVSNDECLVEKYPAQVKGIAFSDMRFFNEYDAIRARGGKVVRVKRKVADVFAQQNMDNSHRSEKEVVSLGDNDFDYIIENYSTLDNLRLNVARMFDVFTGRIMPYDEARENVPPFMRKKE